MTPTRNPNPIKPNSMPYKTERVYIDDPFLDRRTKLLPCQKEMVLYWSARGASQRQLARLFHVSRRLITFILDPAKKKRDLENRAARGGWKQYYDKGKNAEYQQVHRKYKHKILKDTI